MRSSIYTILTVLLVAVMAGCNTTGCLENRSSILLAGFYSSTTQKSISVSSIELGGVDAPDDSLLVTSTETVSSVYLPMRSFMTSTSYRIHYTADGLDDPSYDDIITLDYRSEPYFAGSECGAMYRYYVTRLDYTTHIIDSIALPDSLINNVNIEKMKIFFRTE